MGQVCYPIPLNCDVCFELTLSLSAGLKVAGGLTPFSSPYLWVTDKFGNQYQYQVSVAADGSFTIDPAQFPDSMFNPSAGQFDLFLTSDYAGTIIVPFKFTVAYYLTSYNCIKLSISC